MPFDSRNAPALFKRAWDIILAPLKRHHALIYIGNFVIFFKTPEEHLTRVAPVLQLTYRAGMTLKISKSFFFSDAIDYHGNVMTRRWLHIATKTIFSGRAYKYLATASKWQLFQRLWNVFRRFVPKSSRPTTFLNRRLKKGEPSMFQLNDEERLTVEHLKRNLSTVMVVALSKPGGQFIIDTDACEKRVWCVLLREQEKEET